MMRIRIAIFALLFTPVAVRAEVKLHPLFTDHMVLQRGDTCPVWGTASPGEAVTVKLQSAEGKATADESGHWVVKLPAQAAGGPYELTVSGQNTITLRDVLIGEVWICSGQSNMEWSLKQIGATSAIEASANPKLRLFTVRRNTSAEPLKTLGSDGWKGCDPSSTPEFSAVGYYFGRELQKALGVPVGLIHTSWGGTPAQAWTSKDTLNGVPQLRH